MEGVTRSLMVTVLPRTQFRFTNLYRTNLYEKPRCTAASRTLKLLLLRSEGDRSATAGIARKVDMIRAYLTGISDFERFAAIPASMIELLELRSISVETPKADACVMKKNYVRNNHHH